MKAEMQHVPQVAVNRRRKGLCWSEFSLKNASNLRVKQTNCSDSHPHTARPAEVNSLRVWVCLTHWIRGGVPVSTSEWSPLCPLPSIPSCSSCYLPLPAFPFLFHLPFLYVLLLSFCALSFKHLSVLYLDIIFSSASSFLFSFLPCPSPSCLANFLFSFPHF